MIRMNKEDKTACRDQLAALHDHFSRVTNDSRFVFGAAFFQGIGSGIGSALRKMTMLAGDGARGGGAGGGGGGGGGGDNSSRDDNASSKDTASAGAAISLQRQEQQRQRAGWAGSVRRESEVVGTLRARVAAATGQDLAAGGGGAGGSGSLPSLGLGTLSEDVELDFEDDEGGKGRGEGKEEEQQGDDEGEGVELRTFKGKATSKHPASRINRADTDLSALGAAAGPALDDDLAALAGNVEFDKLALVITGKALSHISGRPALESRLLVSPYRASCARGWGSGVRGGGGGEGGGGAAGLPFLSFALFLPPPHPHHHRRHHHHHHHQSVARLCRVVIACRVSPSQKALIVRMVKKGVKPKPVTLAIGDGANDVTMIQEAAVGVGISGKEGLQAVNASDFAIARFRFLKRLLLLHGRWNYRRICSVVLYSFFKNTVLVMTLFFYQIYDGFSGTSMYETWIYALFNFVLGLPIIAIGLCDKDVDAATAMAVPELYVLGRLQVYMNMRVTLSRVILALLNAVVIFFLGVAFAEPTDPLFVTGTGIFCALILAMTWRACFITKTWTWISHLFVWGSLLAWFAVFLPAYNYWCSFSPEYCGTTIPLYTSGEFWLGYVILIPTVTFLLDLVLEHARLQFAPRGDDILAEIAYGYAGVLGEKVSPIYIYIYIPCARG